MNFESERNLKDFYAQQPRDIASRRPRDDLRSQDDMLKQFENYAPLANQQFDSFPKYTSPDLDSRQKQMGSFPESGYARAPVFDMNAPMVAAGKEHLFVQPPISREGTRGETERDRRLRLRAEERARRMNGDSSSVYTQNAKSDMLPSFSPSLAPPQPVSDLYQNIDPEKLQMYRMEAQRQFEEQKAKMLEEARRMRSEPSSEILPREIPPRASYESVKAEMSKDSPIINPPQQQSNTDEIKKLNYRLELQRQIEEKKQRVDDERRRGYPTEQREEPKSRADYSFPTTAILPGERYDSAPSSSGPSNTVDKKLQYRLELERQIEEKKQRREDIPRGRASEVSSYTTESVIPDRPNSRARRPSSMHPASSEEIDKKQLYKLELERQIEEKKRRQEEERRNMKGIQRETNIEYYDENKPVMNRREDYNRPAVQTPPVEQYPNTKPPKITNPYSVTVEEVEKKNAYRLELQRQIEEQKKRKEEEKLKLKQKEDMHEQMFRDQTAQSEKPLIMRKQDPNRPSNENPNIDRYQELASKKPPTRGEDNPSDLMNRRKDLFGDEPIDIMNMPPTKVTPKNMAFNQPVSNPTEYKPRTFYPPPSDYPSSISQISNPPPNYPEYSNPPSIQSNPSNPYSSSDPPIPPSDLKAFYENYVRELQLLREQAKEEIQRDKEKLLSEMMQQYRGGMMGMQGMGPMGMQSIPMHMQGMGGMPMGGMMPVQPVVYPVPVAVPNNMYWNPSIPYSAQGSREATIPNVYGMGQDLITGDINPARNLGPDPSLDMFPPTKPYPVASKKDLFDPNPDLQSDSINFKPEFNLQPSIIESQDKFTTSENYKLRHSYIKNLEELDKFNPEASLYNTRKWVDFNHHFGSIQVPNNQSLIDLEAQPQESRNPTLPKPRKTWDTHSQSSNPPPIFISPKDAGLYEMKSSESWGESLPSDAFHIAYQGYSPNPSSPVKLKAQAIEEDIEEEINSEEEEEDKLEESGKTYETKRVDMTIPKYSDSMHSSIEAVSNHAPIQDEEESPVQYPMSRNSLRRQTTGSKPNSAKPFVIKGKEIATVVQESPYKMPSETMSSQEGYHYNESFLASGVWNTGAESSWGASKLERGFPSFSHLGLRNESSKEFIEQNERDVTVDSEISRQEYQDQYSLLPPTLPSFLDRISPQKQLSIDPLIDYTTLEQPPVIFPDSLERQESRTGSRSSARHSKPRTIDVFKERRPLESSELRTRSPSRKQSNPYSDSSPNRNRLQEARDKIKQGKDKPLSDDMEKILADIIQKPAGYSKPSSSESQRLKADDKPFIGKFSKIAQNEFRMQRAIQGVNEAIKSSEVFPPISEAILSNEAPASILRPISSAKSSRRYDNIGDVL